MSPKSTPSRYGLKPKSCQIRRQRPQGPMFGCQDLECFDKCVELTLRIRGIVLGSV